jgi:YfiR/HmsC-like
LLGWCVGASTTCLVGLAAAAGYSPAQLEAALLLQIAGFITWPSDAQLPAFEIGVLGATDRFESLGRLAAKTTIRGAKVRVSNVSESGELPRLHVLYLAPALADRLPAVLKRLEAQPVLLATHSPGAARQGAAVNFYEEDAQSRFEINPDALKRRRLQASYKLLSLARIVRDP